MKKRAVFLDRDGTINRDVGYPDSYSLIEIYPYSFEAVRKINESGLLAIIVTNQSGVGKGLIPEKSLYRIHKKISASFKDQGAHFDGIYYCPHDPSSSDPKYRQNCQCRKPNPGMALKAMEAHNIDLANSYMVGDKVEDILFGTNLHITSILVLTGFGRKSLPKLLKRGTRPAFVASNLQEAVNWILLQEKSKTQGSDSRKNQPHS
jgi:D,D-heptose 1,7-bisphosphate phosphatase